VELALEEVLFAGGDDVALPDVELFEPKEGEPDPLLDVEFDCENANVVSDATRIVLNIVAVKTIAKLIFVLLLFIKDNKSR
jgi:hypothetical protein